MPLFCANVGTDVLYLPIYVQKYRKVLAIRKVMREYSSEYVYAETNYQFILSFYDVVMNHIPDVKVIHLRRYLPKVLKSFIELGWFIPGHRYTPFWCGSTHIQSAAVRPLAPLAEMDAVDRCISYLIDVEARGVRFRRQYPRAFVTEIRVEELNSLEHVHHLFSSMGINPTEKTQGLLGKVVYARNERKKKVGRFIEESECLDRILQYIEKCRMKGINLPDLPQMEQIQLRSP